MAEYREMLPMDDPKAVNDLIRMIRNVAKQEVAKAKFNRMIPAVVTNVGVGTADVEFLTDGTPTTITGLANKTGETLVATDEVYVELINSSSSNIYIAIKK